MDMEEAHAQAEPDQEAEPPSSGVQRCGRHPDQLLTGICSSCLMERLSSFGSPTEAEIVEVGTAGAADGDSAGAADGDSAGAADHGKLRKTLMLLFQMDDSGGCGATHQPEVKDPQVTEFEVEPGGGGNRGVKWKGGSWLRSILPRRGMRRSRKEEPSRPPGEGSGDPGGGDVQVERKASFRRSCEWMVCREREQSRGSMEPPRHSWDGSMVSRAFACSFGCLEDPPDGLTRVMQNNAEEEAGESRVRVAESRNGGHSPNAGGNVQRFSRTSGGDAGPEMSVSGVRRRLSNRWSRVWDRSITSPLKEFVRKGEHVLDRSLSESRKETRRCRNGGETADIDGEIQPGRSGLVSSRTSQGATRSSQAAPNGDAHNFRTDWLKNKECKIGRSRSVHYTSPGNLDNGMLRFYLTPMRSNRVANRGRRRNSRLFSRGLFGFI